MNQVHNGYGILTIIIIAATVPGVLSQWIENNIIGPACSGNPVEYGAVPEYQQLVTGCDHEKGHCRPLCIISKLEMMNTDGYFVPGRSKEILQSFLPPLKNRFRATELKGAFESCSLSFNFNDNLGVEDNCASYAPLLDCFRKSTLMICEGVSPVEIADDIGSAADPWPAKFVQAAEPILAQAALVAAQNTTNPISGIRSPNPPLSVPPGLNIQNQGQGRLQFPPRYPGPPIRPSPFGSAPGYPPQPQQPQGIGSPFQQQRRILPSQQQPSIPLQQRGRLPYNQGPIPYNGRPLPSPSRIPGGGNQYNQIRPSPFQVQPQPRPYFSPNIYQRQPQQQQMTYAYPRPQPGPRPIG